ncbi:Gfo/Idh/MocA family protein [Nodosilinea sp. PGN35]|uniref:Gfo/Idh/MocA family protein n=1 Tax=Nodosilinea sp. PGN35 TaxID=3020489 RepID=UPI0023B22A51|nr:Gfo/Idh/MocA family oxidoreductase [Nodosilinea sp. TSF1-S3]MDF0367022.1 Gfo/Idh/MocA family oxidoreductase [Nodosilinea sp. TSF1-S3]
MATEPVKFGLVGAGGIAQAYAQAFAQSAIAQLVGVADLRPEAAAAMAESLGCQSFTDHEAMAEALELDAVIICTPPVTHRAIGTYFLERQVHVLCEKPLSISSEDARAMRAVAEEAGVILTMASKFRYVEDVIKAKSIVESGLLGDIVLFENAFTARVDMTQRWNSDPAISGGGVLIDNGTHSLDIMRYFLGPLAEVQVVEGKRIQGLMVEDTVRIFAKNQSGIIGNIDLSWSINKELDYYIRIYGSQGTISVGWKESKYRQAASSEWIVFGQGYSKVQAFGSQIENFSRAIRGEEALLITADDGVASVAAVEAAYRALYQSRWTAIAPVGVAELAAA